MNFTESIRIKSSPKNIFDLYQDTASWPIWDTEVSFVNLPNGLTLGAKGVLKPKNGPKAIIEIIEFTEGKSFTVASKLPLCQMLFKHEVIRDNQETVVEHSICFSGPFQVLFKYLIGRSIKKSLPSTLQSLKKFVEGR